jgi:hypothetical protein
MKDKPFESGKRGKATNRDKQNGRRGWKAERQAERHAEAEKRNAAWQALSYEEKLVSLLSRPGECRRQIHKLIHERLNEARAEALAEYQVGSPA